MIFICPIDDDIKLSLPKGWCTELIKPHCQTLNLNSNCPYIQIGCRFDKEGIKNWQLSLVKKVNQIFRNYTEI